MPAAIDAATRGDIVFHAALGYSQSAIAEEVGVSRRTVAKYLDRAREEVEGSARPRRTLCRIVSGKHDWDGGERAPEGVDTGDLMSL